MKKRMLIDATHEEETRVAVSEDGRLSEFDYESKYRKPLKSSIFLAKVTRVEPSLQAAFVNFGGNRHGFLPFSEIHPDYFRIPIADREALIEEQERLLREEEEKEEHEELNNPAEIEPEEAYPLEEPEEAEGDHDDERYEDAVRGSEDEAAEEEGGDAQDKQHRGRNNNRYGRRGRRGGRGRAPYRNRSKETFDEDRYTPEQRFRFSLKRKYKIQEVIKRGQIMLVQVSKEERGNKGAAVSTYLSLPGRYCVLMPNSPRAGGVSRKISSYKERNQMRDLLKSLQVPKGMSVILRTAGVSRTKTEVKRDLDYLMRLWDDIRELTLQSSAPALVYEEADLIKRAIRDLYTRDIDEVIVAGEEGYKNAKKFMKLMIPSHAKKVQQYSGDDIPLFNRFNVEDQIAEIGETQVTLKSGGYLVINPTEALVSVDVNSGKSTKERHIEETALRTNLEAAEEVARQLRLRDLGGLVVIDFIDMEDRRNNGKVERRMRDALSGDRARVQMGRISSFGLMELSRQRLNPSLTETQFEICNHCSGTGRVRTADATSIMVLRAIEDEGLKGRAAQVITYVSEAVALYILNYKRKDLFRLEERYKLEVLIRVDDMVSASTFRVEVSKPAHDPQDEDQDSNDALDESSRPSAQRRDKRGGSGRSGAAKKDSVVDSLADDLNADLDDEEADSKMDEGQEEKPKRSRRKSSRAKGSDDKDQGRTKKDEDKSRKPSRDSETQKDDKDGSAQKKDDKKDDSDAKSDSKEGQAEYDKSKKSADGRKAKNDDKPAGNDSESMAEVPRKERPANTQPTNTAVAENQVVNEAPKKKRSGWWNLKN